MPCVLFLWIFTQPVYGFASGDPLRFKRAVGHKDLFYIDDREVDFKEVRTVLMNGSYKFRLYFDYQLENVSDVLVSCRLLKLLYRKLPSTLQL
jgi:hypothetical protein